MRPVTDRFLLSLRESHLISSSCTLVFPDGTEVDVPIEAGQVTIDRTAQARRAGTVQIPWSLDLGEQLGVDVRELPLGGYARLGRGICYPDTTREEALLGMLRVESVTWQTLEASATLEVTDRMAQVRDESFTTPFLAGGLRIADAAIQVVRDVFGSAISYLKPLDPPTILADVFYTGSRADALQILASAASAEVYFDADGSFVFGPADAVGSEVWTVDAGATGVMINAAEALDRTGIYNGVVVEGQSDATSPPIMAVATFDDATSPIRWGGPFGKVAVYVTNTSAQDAAQAQAAAESLLNLRLKQTRQLTLTSSPNPALEAGDTIRVLFPDGRSEQHMIDAVSIDLGTGAQAIQTRARFTPGDLTGAPLRLTTFAGVAAWRELDGAEVMPA